jgi:uncharacterized protein (DUF1697 family)
VTIHIALLRGINVGRNKRIAMGRLRELMADLGYAEAKTHLQSGNVVFDGPRGADTVARAISKRIADDVGLDVKVVVRTRAELAKVVAADPLRDVVEDPTRYFVTFFSGPLPPAEVKAVKQGVLAPDRVEVRRREMYMWLPNGVAGRSFDQAAWEERIKVVATSRNWRTVTKLMELAEALDSRPVRSGSR